MADLWSSTKPVPWSRELVVAEEDTAEVAEDMVVEADMAVAVTEEETDVMTVVVAEATIPADAIGNFEYLDIRNPPPIRRGVSVFRSVKN